MRRGRAPTSPRCSCCSTWRTSAASPLRLGPKAKQDDGVVVGSRLRSRLLGRGAVWRTRDEKLMMGVLSSVMIRRVTGANLIAPKGTMELGKMARARHAGECGVSCADHENSMARFALDDSQAALIPGPFESGPQKAWRSETDSSHNWRLTLLSLHSGRCWHSGTLSGAPRRATASHMAVASGDPFPFPASWLPDLSDEWPRRLDHGVYEAFSGKLGDAPVDSMATSFVWLAT